MAKKLRSVANSNAARVRVPKVARTQASSHTTGAPAANAMPQGYQCGVTAMGHGMNSNPTGKRVK